MSEQVQFHKGTEINLPGANIDNAGHLFHCSDTKNTYISDGDDMQLFASAVGERCLNSRDEMGGLRFGEGQYAHSPVDEVHGIGTSTSEHSNGRTPQFIIGRFNDPTTDGGSYFVIGNGEDEEHQNNLLTVDNWTLNYDGESICLNGDTYLEPLILRGFLDERIDNNGLAVIYGELTGANYDEGLSWNLFESSFIERYPSVYLSLSAESWGYPNPIKLPLIEEAIVGAVDPQNAFHRFAGPIDIYGAKALCTFTWRWSDSGWIYDVDVQFLSPLSILCETDSYTYRILKIDEDNFQPYAGAQYIFQNKSANGQPGRVLIPPKRQYIESNVSDTKFFVSDSTSYNGTYGNTIFVLDSYKSNIYRFSPSTSLSRPQPGIRNYITNNTNTRERPSFNAPVLLGNIGQHEPDGAFSQDCGRYLTSTINKDNPIMADLASGTISAPGGLVIEQAQEDISIITALTPDHLNIRYNEMDLTYGTETESGYLRLISTNGDSYDCTNQLTYDSIKIEKVTEDDDKVLDINTSGISFENRSSRCALSANDNGSVLSLGNNGGADFSIGSYFTSNYPRFIIACDTTNDSLITITTDTTTIQTPNFHVDGLQVDSTAYFISEVTIDGGVYIDGFLENGSGIYTYDTVYAEGNITSEQNIYAQGNINADGTITGDKVYGAVWNDYAEFRAQITTIEPGYCVTSSNSGLVSKTTKKLQACDGIVSDTYGFAIGETDECQTPLAVAGRVLAYCEGDRNSYNAGDTVCAGPNGKVCKMTREEIREWPDRIIGIVSEIPNYETWGSGNVPVNGRIWIKIK